LRWQIGWLGKFFEITPDQGAALTSGEGSKDTATGQERSLSLPKVDSEGIVHASHAIKPGSEAIHAFVQAPMSRIALL